jgi:putative PIN family toxin of toxin-antitoxin system
VRIVIDTNVLLSAFLWGGTPQRLIEAVRSNAAELVISQALLDEFARVIARPKFAAILARTSRTPPSLMVHLRTLAEVVNAPALPQPVCRDPKDDIVLACALAAQAHLVGSGDEDLLSLGQFEGIPILTAAQAVAMIEAG